jgi:uncharacterized membrane protein
MINSIEEYLDQLRVELKNGDAATIQDALADAEEHLRAALAHQKEKQPDISEEDALSQVMEQYGSPAEIASAYREVERLTRSTLIHDGQRSNSFVVRVFAIYADPRTWGALLYMLITFVTGIVYFTWAVTGLMLSLALLILIIGLPFIYFFLHSVRGLALLEGRLVEALLGIRMPRRSRFSTKNVNWWERFKLTFTDRYNWNMLFYMFCQLALGVLYFTLIVVLLSVSLSLIAAPFADMVIKHQNFTDAVLANGIMAITIGNARYYLPTWLYPLISLAGLLLLTTSMHLFKLIGQLHGKYAKVFLVSE